MLADGNLASQVTSMARDLGEVRTSVAVILERTADIKDHEARLRSLEASRSRIWGWWAAAAVIGAGIGYALSHFVGLK